MWLWDNKTPRCVMHSGGLVFWFSRSCRLQRPGPGPQEGFDTCPGRVIEIGFERHTPQLTGLLGMICSAVLIRKNTF